MRTVSQYFLSVIEPVACSFGQHFNNMANKALRPSRQIALVCLFILVVL